MRCSCHNAHWTLSGGGREFCKISSRQEQWVALTQAPEMWPLSCCDTYVLVAQARKSSDMGSTPKRSVRFGDEPTSDDRRASESAEAVEETLLPSSSEGTQEFGNAQVTRRHLSCGCLLC